jgi:hypothetical protein
MRIEIIDKIKQAASQGKEIETSVIEYNCELPKHKDIKKDSFFGVKAKFNPLVKNEIQLTYKM